MPDRLPSLLHGQQRQAGSGRVVADDRLRGIHDVSNGGRPGQDTTKPSTQTGGGLVRRYSVFFGCLLAAWRIHTILRSSSTTYQTRPPLVTSICHWSRLLPSKTTVARSYFSR